MQATETVPLLVRSQRKKEKQLHDLQTEPCATYSCKFWQKHNQQEIQGKQTAPEDNK